MAVSTRFSVLLKLLFLSALFIIPLSSAIANEEAGFKDAMDMEMEMGPIHLLHKDDGVVMNSRKLWMLDARMQDYDDAGANPKHDPRRRPGNGRNP